MGQGLPKPDPIRLEDLIPGLRVLGIDVEAVTVIAAEQVDVDAVTLTFRRADGGLAEQLVFRSHESALRHAPEQLRWTFDGDGAAFRLAAEALRIRMAGLHDPMLAVSSSDVRPLPHQIRAVYGELLPRMPLRFLLADDPGAGKTVMAGLYAKELLLRGDLSRLLIVAPGGLVEQWQDELATKFGMQVEVLSREMAAGAVDGNPFTRHPMLVARMDQLARDEGLQEHLRQSEWDLVIVDEAHRMSARWWSGELVTTKRYQLGQLLDGVTRHLLLMTATPHAGDEENYQLFLALLDPDRFEGRYRAGVHSTDTSGLTRRMVKEELLTFEGKPLFPERIAETVPYQLTGREQDLYEAVTQYVRTEMNRADELSDSPRTRTVGFALTVLQRRLASSTHAILRSLQRRHDRLVQRRTEMLNQTTAPSSAEEGLRYALWQRQVEQLADDDLAGDAAESLEESVVDSATAARTAAELDLEIARLRELVTLATAARDAGEDRKWAEVRSLILDEDLLRDDHGRPRKFIVFTEHRDTLDYLTGQIRNVIGRHEAVVTIHGGTSRQERRRVREDFTHDPSVQVLVATDAAGEGLNLQAVHLMINYDLPWNPNRLEQRFGRIHRIGQQHTCRLWNLVADETREGQVFTRLLSKMEEQRRAYGGRLFDVLGASFSQTPLRDLLIEAIRYGEDPAKMARLDEVIDAEVSSGLAELLDERALARESLGPIELGRLRRQMDEATARRLQPHYVQLLFREAFAQFGGRLAARERGRFEITHVPAGVRQRQRVGTPVPLAKRYERVTFEPGLVGGTVSAELLAPGHPLVDIVLDATIEAHLDALTRGAVLVDLQDGGTATRLVVALTIEIANAAGTVVSKRFEFVSLGADGRVVGAGPAPYLDAVPLPTDAQRIVSELLAEPWLAGGADRAVSHWAVSQAQPAHLAEVAARLVPGVERTRQAVRQRLVHQINYLYSEAGRLRDEADAQTGGRKRRRSSPEWHESRARDLEVRLATRLGQLDREGQLHARPPKVVGAALIVPAGRLAEFGPGDLESADFDLAQVESDGRPPMHAQDTRRVERRAVDAALAAERSLGRVPTEMAHNNPGFDLRSSTPDGGTVWVEVKGRIDGADDFFVTYNEVLFGKNAGAAYRLVLVRISPLGPEHDTLRYLVDPFRDTDLGSFASTGIRGDLNTMWHQGSTPL